MHFATKSQKHVFIYQKIAIPALAAKK